MQIDEDNPEQVVRASYQKRLLKGRDQLWKMFAYLLFGGFFSGIFDPHWAVAFCGLGVILAVITLYQDWQA